MDITDNTFPFLMTLQKLDILDMSCDNVGKFIENVFITSMMVKNIDA